MLAAQKLVLVVMFNISPSTVISRRSFGINVIDHIGMAVNSTVNMKVHAGFNASSNFRIDMCSSNDSNARISVRIISAAKTGR